MTILVIAAEAMELKGLETRLQATQEPRWALPHATHASFKGREWFMATNGPGPNLAAEACGEALNHIQPSLIINTGFCGGIDPALRPGQIIVANKVISSHNGNEFAAAVPGECGGLAIGSIVSGDRVIVSSQEKAALRGRTGASVVDMESAAVAEFAQRLAVPFYCIRSVSDTASDNLPLDFNAYRGQDGRFRTSAIALHAALRPWSRIPALIAMYRQCRLASDNLGEILVDLSY